MKMENLHQMFDSIEDFIDFGKLHQSHAEYGQFGGGTDGWHDIEEMAYKGWEAGAQRAERMRMEVEDRIESLGLEGLDAVEEYDVSGAFVDVGAFCEGEPECMVEYEEKMMPRQRVAKIYVQINYLSSVTCEEAERRGVAITAIVDALEAHGIQCEVWAVDYSETLRSAQMHKHAVLVKAAGQLMPIDRMAFAIGHPAFYRGASFAARGGIGGTSEGRTARVPEDWMEEGELLIPPIEPGKEQWANDAAAIAWVSEHVSNFLDRVTA